MQEKILVVDDELEILKVVSTRLLQAGYEVYITPNAGEVFDLVEKHRPDLILMDILMPDMSGGDIVKALKQDEKTKDIAVVFLSAVYNDQLPQGKEAKGIQVDGKYYPAVGKPYEISHLLEVIKKNLL